MTATEWLNTLSPIIVLSLLGYSAFWVGFNGGDVIVKVKRSRHKCKNCHFLMKISPHLPLTSWNEKDREEGFPRSRIPPNKLEHDGWRGYESYDMTIGCHKRIWTQTHNELSDADSSYYKEILRKTVSRNRGESCFFVPFYEGMPMENAEQLFSVKSENRRTNKRIIWAQIGSGLALATSIVSVYLQFR